jgi:hypothetical protein
MANFLEDNLDGTFTETLDGSNLDPEVGDANSWVRVQTDGAAFLDDLDIKGDGLGVYSTSANAAVYNSTDPGSTDYEVVATILNGDDSDPGKAGVTLRNATGLNASRYCVEWDNSANVVQIRKHGVDNSASTLGSTYSYTGPGAGNTFELKGSVSGSATTTIKAYVDGVEVLSYDDSSSPITATGRAGLSIRAGGGSGATQILNVTAAEISGDVQLLAPIQDISAGTWLPSSGSPAELWQMIDGEKSPDSDYAYTTAAGTMEVKFGPGSTPSEMTGHTLRYRLRGNGTCDALVKLKQGSTVISQWTETNVPAVDTDYARTLDSSPSFSITDYSDLRISVEAIP